MVRCLVVGKNSLEKKLPPNREGVSPKKVAATEPDVVIPVIVVLIDVDITLVDVTVEIGIAYV